MDNIRLRRYLNQAVIDNKICGEIHCSGTRAVCSHFLLHFHPDYYSHQNIPCHIWKRTGLIKLLDIRK